VDSNSGDGAWLRMRLPGYQAGVVPPADPGQRDGWDDWLVIATQVDDDPKSQAGKRPIALPHGLRADIEIHLSTYA